ncbi:Uncharacterised protein [uncultured archaeon]|nr:Uncharacterised protein [uncultured archaeon]
MKLRGKKAQLTIFIILGIIIVVGVLLAIYLSSKPTAERDPSKDPQGYIEDCMKGLLINAEAKLLPQAGYRLPTNFILYNETKVPYLCYTSQNEKLCTNLEPLLRDKIQNELRLETQAGVEKCFDKLRTTYQNFGYQAGPTNYSVEIVAGSLIAHVNKNIKITRDQSTQEFNYFEYKESSPIFDFIILTNDILTRETTCDCANNACRADVLALSKLNPRYELALFVTSKNENVYTIQDTVTPSKFMFSVRNCVRLP